MKGGVLPRHPPTVDLRTTMTVTGPAERVREVPSLAQLHADHARFVWRSLSRLGVREVDLPDQLQEVFVVVHRRLHTYQPERAKPTTWLFGICVRVARSYRRRARARHEEPVSSPPERVAPRPSPEEGTALREAAETLERILAQMSVEQRAAFVMYELEGLDCVEIAAMEGVPVGTVYSRLHAARALFTQAVERLDATQRREVGR